MEKTNELIQKYKDSIANIVSAFCAKQFDYPPEIEYIEVDIIDINSYPLYLADIILDLRKEAPKGAIFDWAGYNTEIYEAIGTYINYRSWLMGYRHNLKKLQFLLTLKKQRN